MVKNVSYKNTQNSARILHVTDVQNILRQMCSDEVQAPDRKMKELLLNMGMTGAAGISWSLKPVRRAERQWGARFILRVSLPPADIWAHTGWPGSRKCIVPGEEKQQMLHTKRQQTSTSFKGIIHYEAVTSVCTMPCLWSLMVRTTSDISN